MHALCSRLRTTGLVCYQSGNGQFARGGSWAVCQIGNPRVWQTAKLELPIFMVELACRGFRLRFRLRFSGEKEPRVVRAVFRAPELAVEASE
jgi:hypothetical protein